MRTRYLNDETANKYEVKLVEIVTKYLKPKPQPMYPNPTIRISVTKYLTTGDGDIPRDYEVTETCIGTFDEFLEWFTTSIIHVIRTNGELQGVTINAPEYKIVVMIQSEKQVEIVVSKIIEVIQEGYVIENKKLIKRH